MLPMISISVRDERRLAELRVGRVGIALLAALLGFALCAGRVAAQQPTSAGAGVTIRMSLDEALRMAQLQSQTIQIARSGVARATGQRIQARSQQLPQLNAQASYARTLQSQFSGFASSSSSSDTVATPTTQSLCTPFIASTATAAERAAALAQAATCPAAGGGGGLDFSKTSFGAKNQYQLSLAFSQNVYSGGRIAAQNSAAEAQVRSANIEVTAQQAQ